MEEEVRYFRRSHDQDQTDDVWRLRPGQWGERWSVGEQRWVTKDERENHGLVYWLWFGEIDLDEISEEQAQAHIAGLNRGEHLTSASVAALLEGAK